MRAMLLDRDRAGDEGGGARVPAFRIDSSGRIAAAPEESRLEVADSTGFVGRAPTRRIDPVAFRA
jgi:hypothetical protein